MAPQYKLYTDLSTLTACETQGFSQVSVMRTNLTVKKLKVIKLRPLNFVNI